MRLGEQNPPLRFRRGDPALDGKPILTRSEQDLDDPLGFTAEEFGSHPLSGRRIEDFTQRDTDRILAVVQHRPASRGDDQILVCHHDERGEALDGLHVDRKAIGFRAHSNATSIVQWGAPS